MRITITGATGLIGGELRRHLTACGHELRCLSRKAPPQPGWFTWDASSGTPPRESLEGSDAVIHLAGEPVAQRWSPEVKLRIRSSRERGTQALVQTLSALNRRPEVLVSASAIGYYGDRADELLSETALPGSGFLAEVCVEWERAARLAGELGIRVVCVRIGVVLHPHGGALATMLPPVRLGLGGPIAGGQAWLSWIHHEDLMRLFAWAVENPAVRGPVNAVSPGAVRNGVFMRALGATLHRPAAIPVPAFAMRLMYGEMASVILGSQHVVPEAATHSGFHFSWPELAPALRNLLS
jgi:uncharacterized protein (TIGR01777 family)